MLENDTWRVPTEYTYRDMTKPEKREWMSHAGIAKLGTQSGGFGVFQEQFRVVPLTSLQKIRDELIASGLDLDACPMLKQLTEE